MATGVENSAISGASSVSDTTQRGNERADDAYLEVGVLLLEVSPGPRDGPTWQLEPIAISQTGHLIGFSIKQM
jgi:hypothetical protein